MVSSEIECCSAMLTKQYTWLKKVCVTYLSIYTTLINILCLLGASPYQIDSVLKNQLGLAMGIFEMFDLAGIDIGWRQRKEMGLTDPSKRDPCKRYSSLMDKLCEKGLMENV